MKGLMRKDLELLMGNYKVLAAALLFAVFFMVSSDDNLFFVVYYLTMMAGFLVLSTMSYDDFDNGMGFLMTLPVTRKTYVREKYIFGMGCVAVGWGTSVILSLVMIMVKGYTIEWSEWFANIAGAILVFGLIVAVMIPTQLKFGSENMRIMLIGMMLLVFGIGFLAYKIASAAGVDLQAAVVYLDSLSVAAVVIAVIVIEVLALAISCKISENILEKKEF